MKNLIACALGTLILVGSSAAFATEPPSCSSLNSYVEASVSGSTCTTKTSGDSTTCSDLTKDAANKLHTDGCKLVSSTSVSCTCTS